MATNHNNQLENIEIIMSTTSAAATTDEENTKVNIQTNHKRTLYFSDGIMEEFSDEADDDDETDGQVKSKIDESKLSWATWLLQKANKTGDTLLSGVDYVGESVTTFLGITPNYDKEIERYRQMQGAQEKFARAEREASAGWVGGHSLNNFRDDIPVTEQNALPLSKIDVHTEPSQSNKY